MRSFGAYVEQTLEPLIELLNREAVATQSPRVAGLWRLPWEKRTPVSYPDLSRLRRFLFRFTVCSARFGATPFGVGSLARRFPG